MLKILKYALSIFTTMLQNQQRSEHQAAGARKAELERRYELDKVKERAEEHREDTVDNSGRDVAGRM